MLDHNLIEQEDDRPFYHLLLDAIYDIGVILVSLTLARWIGIF